MDKGMTAMERRAPRTSRAVRDERGSRTRTGDPRGPRTVALLLALAAAVPACASIEDPNGGRTSITRGEAGEADGADPADESQTMTPEEKIQEILDRRKADYGEALRTASLKLRDRLPDFAEIKQIEGTADDAAKKAVYDGLVDDMIASPEFSRAMIKFWKDTFRVAQVGNVQNNVDKDAAPTFAAQVVVEDRSFSELLTANANTCPTYDEESNTFSPASCPLPTNAVDGPTVGVLTDPGIQAQYYANMAFRRVRFVQETFICSKFPAESSDTPVPMGDGVFTGAIAFSSITGLENDPKARVDFQETKAVVCANCHVNLNHVAPLFLNWDDKGVLKNSPQVKVPIMGEPAAARGDYLPDGEGLLWRKDKPITDMASLGKAIAEDPDMARCAVNRVWNFAMSRGDIVDNLAEVPSSVTQAYVDKFTAGGMKLKETIRDVFKSEDFTKF